MEEFYNNGKAVIGFLIIVLLFTMFTDEKTTQYMILIVILGMLLVNSEIFINFLKK